MWNACDSTNETGKNSSTTRFANVSSNFDLKLWLKLPGMFLADGGGRVIVCCLTGMSFGNDCIADTTCGAAVDDSLETLGMERLLLATNIGKSKKN